MRQRAARRSPLSQNPCKVQIVRRDWTDMNDLLHSPAVSTPEATTPGAPARTSTLVRGERPFGELERAWLVALAAVVVFAVVALLRPETWPWMIGGMAAVVGAAWLVRGTGGSEARAALRAAVPALVDPVDVSPASPGASQPQPLLESLFEAMSDPVLVIAGGGGLDPETGEWFDDRGQSLGWCRPSEWPMGRLVKTILTCAHLDQNPAHNDPAHLAALCPRCHWRHDRRQHIQSAYRNRRKPWAVKDLFDGLISKD